MTTTWRPRRAEAGFTLVELMVTAALGLVLAAVAITAWLSGLSAARRAEALVQVTEDAALALGLMRAEVAQAGFSLVHGIAPDGLVLHAFPAAAGCRAAGFVDLQASILAAPACKPAVADPDASDALEVAHEAGVLAAGVSNAILGGAATAPRPLDCLGNSFATTHDAATGDDYWLSDSKFYVADDSLYCHGPGNAAGAALVQNVEVLKVGYGMAAGPAGADATAQVAYQDAAPPPGSADWAAVVSVELCVQVRSAVRVLDPAAAATLGTWIDCAGVSRTAADGYLRRAFGTTVLLRNGRP